MSNPFVTQTIFKPEAADESEIIRYALPANARTLVQELQLACEPDGHQSLSITLTGDLKRGTALVTSILKAAGIESKPKHNLPNILTVADGDPALLIRVAALLTTPTEKHEVALPSDAASAIVSHECKRTGESAEKADLLDFRTSGGYETAYISRLFSPVTCLHEDGSWVGGRLDPLTEIEFHTHRENILEALAQAAIPVEQDKKNQNHIIAKAPLQDVADTLLKAGLLHEFVSLQITRRATSKTSLAEKASRYGSNALGYLGGS
jgi:hypothetical protein